MTTYQPRLQPRDYQAAALDKMAGRRAFALLMRPRTGKTKVALDDYGRLEAAGEVDDLLVIAPAGVYLTWLGELDKQLDPALRSRLAVHAWKSGRSWKKGKPGKELDAFLKMTTPRVFLVNVEALSGAKTGARQACEEFAKVRRVMIAIDESTKIKNLEALRTQYVVGRLGPLASYRRILTGLPTPRSPLDLYTQFKYLDPNILKQSTFAAFRARYAITKRTDFGGKLRRPIEIVVGYRNTEELPALIEPHSHRVEFRPDVPSTYSIREVELTPEQKRVYAELKEYACARLEEEGSHVTASLVITQMLRLHQVLCGHVVDENGVERTIAENKTDALLDELEEFAGKAVIWATYDADVRKVADAIADAYTPDVEKFDEWGRRRPTPWPNPYVARFWGGNLKTREEEERLFKTDPRCRFMVATASAGGMGRTWDVADLVVYYSSTYDLEHREQSEQRPLNVGKDRGVDYVDIIAPGTVEMKILKALREKINIADAIVGGNGAWRDWVI